MPEPESLPLSPPMPLLTDDGSPTRKRRRPGRLPISPTIRCGRLQPLLRSTSLIASPRPATRRSMASTRSIVHIAAVSGG